MKQDKNRADKPRKFNSLVEWHSELKRLAEGKNLGFLVTTPDDHIAGFEDGDSPGEELNNLISICDD